MADLIPYLAKVRSRRNGLFQRSGLKCPRPHHLLFFERGEKCPTCSEGKQYTVIIMSEVAPHMMANGKFKPGWLEDLRKDVKKFAPSLTVISAETMVWGRNSRVVFLDDSANKIMEFLKPSGLTQGEVNDT